MIKALKNNNFHNEMFRLIQLMMISNSSAEQYLVRIWE